jgi:Tfp pilus assembly protein PilF
MKLQKLHLIERAPSRFFASLLACSALLVAGCNSGLPAPSSKDYLDFVSAFYVGLAALQVGDDDRAESSLGKAAKLAPGEPVAWANWGVLALRQRNFDIAQERLTRAHELAQKDDHIKYLLGVLESDRGNSSGAIADLRETIKLNPSNLQAAYQLALEVERQGGPDGEAEFQRLVTQILAVQPNNLAALLELSRIAAKRGDGATLRSAVGRITAQSASWPADGKAQLAELQTASTATPPTAAAIRSVFLRNVLMQVQAFRQNLAVIKAAPGEEAKPFLHFLRLPTPDGKPAAPDLSRGSQPIRRGKRTS